MSSGFSGADVAQLRGLSRKLKVQAGKIREIANSSSAAIAYASWTGNEIESIRSKWKRESYPTLKGLADSLDQLAIELERNATQQETASGAASGANGGNLIDDFRRKLDDFIGGIVGGVVNGWTTGPGDSDEPKAEQPVAPHAPTPDPEAMEHEQEKGLDPGPAPFNISDAQRDYNAGGFTNQYFAPGGGGEGQCTSWVNFRRKQLGYDPVPIAWKGESFYPGEVTTNPTTGAVGSFSGAHTFVVEQVSQTEPRTIVVSEMNVGKRVPGQPEYITEGQFKVSTATYSEISPGQWRKDPGGAVHNLRFGA